MRKILCIVVALGLSSLWLPFFSDGDLGALPVKGPSGPTDPGPGTWMDVGHPNCGDGPPPGGDPDGYDSGGASSTSGGDDYICADWFTIPDYESVATCCMPRSMVGSASFQDCQDFRAPHGPGDNSEHVAEP